MNCFRYQKDETLTIGNVEYRIKQFGPSFQIGKLTADEPAKYNNYIVKKGNAINLEYVMEEIFEEKFQNDQVKSVLGVPEMIVDAEGKKVTGVKEVTDVHGTCYYAVYPDYGHSLGEVETDYEVVTLDKIREALETLNKNNIIHGDVVEYNRDDDVVLNRGNILIGNDGQIKLIDRAPNNAEKDEKRFLGVGENEKMFVGENVILSDRVTDTPLREGESVFLQVRDSAISQVGKVVKYNHGGEYYFIKFAEKTGQECPNDIDEEQIIIDGLKDIPHTTIPELVDTKHKEILEGAQVDGYCSVVYRSAKKTFDFNTHQFNEDQCKQLVINLLEATGAMKEMRKQHGDIKPANCMCFMDGEKTEFLLTDFGTYGGEERKAVDVFTGQDIKTVPKEMAKVELRER